MKALVREKYGSPGALRVSEIPIQPVKDDEVLVRVYATTVNRTDSAMLTGKPLVFRLVIGLRKPKRVVLGTDFAGSVEAVGKQVTKFSVGDKIWGFHDEGLGTQAEFVSVPESEAILKIPEALSYKEIVACAEGAHYAYSSVKKISVEPGSKVLINGATGAIGTALLQILKYQKAEVTAVGNTENLQLLRSLGADTVINYRKANFLETKQKYNLICDVVGKSSYFKCKPLLLTNGIYISTEFGSYAQNLILPLLTRVFFKSRVMFPFPADRPGSLLFIKGLIEKKCFKAVIDKEYSLSEAEQAYEYVLSGEKTGNVVLNIQAEPGL